MARPIKHTVDYFPHLCKKGKTLPILESQYGNNGYAFWFKLLEVLATTEGHYFDASNPLQFEYLTALTKFPREETPKILSLLAEIDAIDKDLWEQSKLIWCQNLVDNVADVYRLRKGLLPEKPYFLNGKLCQNIQSNGHNPVSNNINTQSKVKESIVNKTKVNNNDETLEKSVLQDNLSDGKKLKKYPPEFTPLRQQVFAGLTSRRGYPSRQPMAEAKAISDMLKENCTPEQILTAYDRMKQQPFYQDKNLSMMSVKKDIHEVLKNGENRQYPQIRKPVTAIPGNKPAGAFDDL